MMSLHTKSNTRILADEERCWQALMNRDASLDGVIFFGVRSTGIYCRPICPARKPRREHVSFYGSTRDAERAGFRPCLRCRPHEAGSDPNVALVEKICAYIEARGEEPVTLAAIGRHVGRSPHHAQRVFKEKLGISPRQYASAKRAARLKAQLQDGADVTTATYAAGYGSSSRLYEGCHDELGMTPATYRRGAEGVSIAYSAVETVLGWLLVARTERGICAVRLGDDPHELADGLADEFPHGRITRDDQELSAVMSGLVRQLAGETPHRDLPLDIRATAFQRRVWDELRAIPRGEVRTYGEIADAIGQPAAVRAVGRACGANPVALAIPCHRVVPASGGLGGYRWGVARKQALLALEQAQSVDRTEIA